MADLRNLAAALRPSVDLLAAAGETDRHAVRSCARCGCTDERACVGTIGPCWWSAADLCCYCAAPRLEFRLRRPASVDRALPTTKPDRDKLERAVCDALTGVLWVDDCQVVDGPVRKLYVDAANPPGVRAIVMQLPALPRR